MTVILRGTTPTLTSYPRLDAGPVPLLPPLNAEARVATPSTAWPDEITGWTAAVVDATDKTVATADEGARELVLNNTTGIDAGRAYLLVDADAVFLASVEAITSTGVRLGEPLRRDVSAAARLVGWAVEHALTTAETSAVGGAVVQWRCDIGGQSVSWTDALRIARRLPVIPLTTAQLVQTYPSVKQLHSRQDETLEQLIAAAWEHVLLPRVLLKGTYPEDIIDAGVLRPALAAACVLHAVRQERNVEADFVMRWSEEFDRQVSNAVGRIDWHEDDQSSSPGLEPDSSKRRLGPRLKL